MNSWNSITLPNIKYKYFLNLILLLFVSSIYIDSTFRIIFEIFFYGIFLTYFIFKNKKFTIYTMWSLIIISIFSLTIIWSSDKAESLLQLRILGQSTLIGTLLIGYLDDKDKIVDFYKIIILSGLILILYLLSFIPLSELLSVQSRLGGIEGVTINSNDIGLRLATSGLFIFSFLRKKNSIINLSLSAVFFYFIIITGSRKAILVFIMGIIGLIFMKSKNQLVLVRNSIIVLILTLLTIYLLLNVPILYDIAGSRFEGMFSAFINGSHEDTSIIERSMMINKGLKLIESRPLFGSGVGSFSYLSGLGVYSHNNYIEMLVGTGIIGTLAYYSIYIIIIKKLLLNISKPIVQPIVILMLMLPIIELALVNYNVLYWHIIIALAFSISHYATKIDEKII